MEAHDLHDDSLYMSRSPRRQLSFPCYIVWPAYKTYLPIGTMCYTIACLYFRL